MPKRYIGYTLFAMAGIFVGWILLQGARYVFFSTCLQNPERVVVAFAIALMLGFIGTFPGLWEK